MILNLKKPNINPSLQSNQVVFKSFSTIQPFYNTVKTVSSRRPQGLTLSLGEAHLSNDLNHPLFKATQFNYLVGAPIREKVTFKPLLLTDFTNLESTSTISPLGGIGSNRIYTSLKGEFYSSNFNYQHVNFISSLPEIWHFNLQLAAQGELVNSLRWSYRYSNLHRRTMFNSHKLTEVKKLLSIGYFDSTSTKLNI